MIIGLLLFVGAGFAVAYGFVIPCLYVIFQLRKEHNERHH